MRILVVDDSPAFLRLLTNILERAGHQPVPVNDVDAALEALAAEPLSLVLTDWVMEGRDGIDLCRAIRSARNRPYTFVIMVTGQVGRECWMEAMHAGVDDFVAKPIDAEALLMRVAVAERVLGVRHQLDALEAILPMCCYCKRIQDEPTGVWSEVAAYLQEHVDVSHGICPRCWEREVRPHLEAP